MCELLYICGSSDLERSPALKPSGIPTSSMPDCNPVDIYVMNAVNKCMHACLSDHIRE